MTHFKLVVMILLVLLCTGVLFGAVEVPVTNVVALTVQVNSNTATVEAFGLAPCTAKVEGNLNLEVKVGEDWVLAAPQTNVSLDVIRGKREIIGKFENLPTGRHRVFFNAMKVASFNDYCIVGTSDWPVNQSEYANFVVGEIEGWNSPLALSLMRDSKGRRLIEVTPYATARRVNAWRTCTGSGLNALTGCASRAEMFFGGGGIFFITTEQLLVVPTVVGTDTLDVFYVQGNDGNSFSLYLKGGDKQ